MIVKFHARGTGKGTGPVDYLLGKDRQRAESRLLRGNPDDIVAIIDSSPYAKAYTSGVLSFSEADLPEPDKEKLITNFEKALLPGLDADQYACLWVEHRDKGRLELNFVVPNIELQSGKRLQPWFAPADKPRIDAWKTVINTQLGLHDPSDPLNRRTLCTPRDLPAHKQTAAQSITDGLLNLVSAGEVRSRQDVIRSLENTGFTIARETRSSISIADPEGGRNIRLKGMIYERDFKFGEGVRGEIQAAGRRYREESAERVRAARAVYQRGAEIKRGENQRRHQRPGPEAFTVRAPELVMAPADRDHRDDRLLGRNLVSGASDIRQLEDDRQTEAGDRADARPGWKPDLDHLRGQREEMSRDRHEGGFLRGSQPVHDTEGVLNHDRTGKTVTERVRAAAERLRDAFEGMGERLRQYGADVLHYARGERADNQPGTALERSGAEFERAAAPVSAMIAGELARREALELELQRQKQLKRPYNGPKMG